MGGGRRLVNELLHSVTLEFIVLKNAFKLENHFVSAGPGYTPSLIAQSTERSSKAGIASPGTRTDSGVTDSFKKLGVSFIQELSPDDKNKDKEKQAAHPESPLTEYYKESVEHQPFGHNVYASDEEYEAMRKKFEQWKNKMDSK